MFTGIVEEVGQIAELDVRPGLTRLRIAAGAITDGLALGESVAINGTCLTVVEHETGQFQVEATPETLRRTNLGELRVGDGVHLERSLRAGDRIGGHFVQGHVDAVGTIAGQQPEGESLVATFSAPPEVMRYVAPKGSIAVDGVSLTVVDVRDGAFTVALIPHTLGVTLLGKKPVGARVNLEADMLAKYVARAAAYDALPKVGQAAD